MKKPKIKAVVRVSGPGIKAGGHKQAAKAAGKAMKATGRQISQIGQQLSEASAQPPGPPMLPAGRGRR